MIPKFRAWDEETESMLYVLGFDLVDNTIWSYYQDYKLNKCNIMQSTGLIDKNGEEIFEGDIITWESPEMTQSTWIGTVFRNGAEFYVRKSKKTYSTGAWLNSACRPTNNIITVIGDIHQNPELLEGSHA